ncbi:hypothetical protein ACHAWF_013529 [Thalassiosira exigua]
MAIRDNKTLEEVDLSFSKIGDEGAKSLANALGINTSLKEIGLSHNQISDVGAQHLAKSLAGNKTLHQVLISNNLIGDKGGRSFVDALKSTHYMDKLCLSGNKISKSVMRRIEAILRDPKRKALTSKDTASGDKRKLGNNVPVLESDKRQKKGKPNDASSADEAAGFASPLAVPRHDAKTDCTASKSTTPVAVQKEETETEDENEAPLESSKEDYGQKLKMAYLEKQVAPSNTLMHYYDECVKWASEVERLRKDLTLKDKRIDKDAAKLVCLNKECHQLRDKKQSVEENLRALREVKQQLEKQASELSSENERLRNDLNLKTKRIGEDAEKLVHLKDGFHQLRDEKQSIQDDLLVLQEEKQQLEEKALESSAEVEQLRKDLILKDKRIDEDGEKLVHLDSECHQLRDEKQSIEERLCVIQKDQQQLEENASESSAEVEQLRKDLTLKDKRVDEDGEKLVHLERECDQLRDEKQSIKEELCVLREDHKQLEKNASVSSAEVEQLRKDLTLKDKRIGEDAEKLVCLESECDQLKGHNRSIQDDLHMLREEQQQLAKKGERHEKDRDPFRKEKKAFENDYRLLQIEVGRNNNESERLRLECKRLREEKVELEEENEQALLKISRLESASGTGSLDIDYHRLEEERDRLLKENETIENKLRRLQQERKNNNPNNKSDRQLRDHLRNELSALITKGDVAWDQVAGMEEPKRVLKTAVIRPAKFPDMFKNRKEPYKMILLFGPPGTGKSYIAQAVATEADCTFFSIKASSIGSMWKGESEQKVKLLFDLAREKTRAVIFIDEIDAICGKREFCVSKSRAAVSSVCSQPLFNLFVSGDGSIEDSDRKVLAEFLIQTEGVDGNSGNVFVLAATNTPKDLDKSLVSRFKKCIYVPPPNEGARLAMLKVHIGGIPHTLVEEDFKKLARSTEGASARDIGALVEEASNQQLDSNYFLLQGGKYEPVACCSNCTKTPSPCSQCGARKMTWEDVPYNQMKEREVSMKDFEKNLKPSYRKYSEDSLKMYRDWAAKHE